MSFTTWLERLKERRPPAPPRPERGPAADTLEERFSDTAAISGDFDSIEGVAVFLEYANIDGEISTRRVIGKRVTENRSGNTYLHSWCLLRNDDRCFRADRMLKLMIPPRWQPVADPVEFLRDFLPKPAPVQPRRPTPREWASGIKMHARHGLSLLTYVARADGEFAPTELEFVKIYIREIAKLVGAPEDERIVELVLQYAETLYPTKRSMPSVLQRLDEREGALEIVMPCLEGLIRADGDYDDAEREAMQILVSTMQRSRNRRGAASQ